MKKSKLSEGLNTKELNILNTVVLMKGHYGGKNKSKPTDCCTLPTNIRKLCQKCLGSVSLKLGGGPSWSGAASAALSGTLNKTKRAKSVQTVCRLI